MSSVSSAGSNGASSSMSSSVSHDDSSQASQSAATDAARAAETQQAAITVEPNTCQDAQAETRELKELKDARAALTPEQRNSLDAMCKTHPGLESCVQMNNIDQRLQDAQKLEKELCSPLMSHLNAPISSNQVLSGVPIRL